MIDLSGIPLARMERGDPGHSASRFSARMYVFGFRTRDYASSQMPTDALGA
jgi:hypothetical protein